MRIRRATQAASPIAPGAQLPVPGGQPGTTAGWRPFGHGQHPSDQIGAYAGQPLNQFPAYLPGVQRYCGVEGLSSRYFQPTVSAIPLNLMQTQQGAGAIAGSGYQRRGATYTGPIGPITARKYKRAVTANSIAQTAVGAEPWAQHTGEM